MQLLRKVLLFFSAMGFWGTVSAQGKILFNATKAETAGNADWIVDTDFNNITWNPNACLNCGSFANESSPQRFPTPAQSGISAATTETYWNGGISAWGVDCVKRGFTVESLPYYGSITYGNTSNPQDLSNYRVFVLPEPNILFTAAEKTAIFNFIKNGGGLFIVSGHSQNDRNNDGNDSPAILNDLLSNNGVGNGALGFTVDVQSFSQTSSNIPFLPSDSIVNGPYGNVSQVKWSSGTSVTLFPSQNPTVKGVVYKTGSSGNTGVLCAYVRYQKGRVAVIGDSSPIDDGTGDVNDQLYPGYTGDVNGNHRRLIMNITVWLANSNSAISVPEYETGSALRVYPNPSSGSVFIESEGVVVHSFQLYSQDGRLVHSFSGPVDSGTEVLNTKDYARGVYFLYLNHEQGRSIRKLVVTD